MKSKKLKVAVIGAQGRMGLEIRDALAGSKAAHPYLGIVRKGVADGFLRSSNLTDKKALSDADVWIDFSGLEAFSEVIRLSCELKKPLVSGVTGLRDKETKMLAKAGQKTALLWAPNMSLGVAALRKALAIAAELEGFDFQIEEFHHRHKRDRPSGTAILLQNELKKYVTGPLPDPISVRGGGIFGVHKVWMMSQEETICLEHQALSRAVFAKGAVAAATWLAQKPKGLYTIDDLFGG